MGGDVVQNVLPPLTKWASLPLPVVVVQGEMMKIFMFFF
jgi:hypothetical protein